MDTTTNPAQSEDLQLEPDAPDARPVLIVAPDVVGGRDFVVIRELDDTDMDYQSRCDLLELLLDHADRA